MSSIMSVFRLLSLFICSTAVFVSAVNGQGQCPNGFIEQSSLPDLVNAAVTRPEGYLYLFFSVNFTCQFKVSGFILLATEDDGAGEYPFIQIWRETSANSNFYNRIHSIGSSDEVTFIGNSLYRYTPTSGNITLLPGDILGLLALSNAHSRVTPYLLNQSSPQYYEISVGLSQIGLTQVFANNPLNFRNQYSPLVAIELMNPFSSLSISSSIQTTITLTSVPTSIKTSAVYPSLYLTSTEYSALIITSSSRTYFAPTTVFTLSNSSSIMTTITLKPLPTTRIILLSPVYPSSYKSLTSTNNSALIMTSSMYFAPKTMPPILSLFSPPSPSKTLTPTLLASSSFSTTSTPLLSSPTTFSPILAGVIGGAIVAVVGIIVCLLVIAVYCIKKKVHHSEADGGGAALGLQTSSTMKIEQRNNSAYSTVSIINDPTYDSATEMQTNVAYASTNFDTATVNASYTEVDTYDIIQD